MLTLEDEIVRSVSISKAQDGAVGIMIECEKFDSGVPTQIQVSGGALRIAQAGRLLVDVEIARELEEDICETHELRVLNVCNFGRVDEAITITEPLTLQ